MTTKPARIKLSLSRKLDDSEVEYFKDSLDMSYRCPSGKIKTMVLVWQPHTRLYRAEFMSFKVRLSNNQQVYAESTSLNSRRLFNKVRKLLNDYFVNVHPTAVKTLRELE